MLSGLENQRTMNLIEDENAQPFGFRAGKIKSNFK